MGSFKKNIGVLLVILGAVLLLLPVFISGMTDLLDHNAYSLTGILLVVLGVVAHILLNKYLPLGDDDEKEARAERDYVPEPDVRKV